MYGGKCGMIYKCEKCGKLFKRRPSSLRKRIYCSNECYRTYKLIECAYCGKEKKVLGVRLKERNYCSTKCQLKYEYENGIRNRKPNKKLYEAHKIKCSGNNSHLWQGGITSETGKRLNTNEWKKIRKEVYERDNWQCKVCGKHCKRDIQCHHIIPYRISKNDNKDNLITLCVKCHRKQDMLFNRRCSVEAVE
jgi:hypothetical protein